MRDQQLTLHLNLPDYAVFESYFEGPNREAVRYLASDASTIAWLWGEPSTGKTHLLQAVAATTAHAAYLPLEALKQYGPSVLEGYDAFDVVCIDQLDAIVPASTEAGEPDQHAGATGLLSEDEQRRWEQALFGLYQSVVSERQRRMVIATRVAPKNCRFLLPDLASRLLSGPVFRLKSLNDKQRLEAIQLRARRRGMTLPDSTGRYLLKRLKRDMRSLCEFLDRLEDASLVHKSPLTIPLVRMTLDDAADAR